jgi:hypothetical protein
MSRTSKPKLQTPSTVEAIRMASASVLGSTTSRGFRLGSAIGSGTMMEQNSTTVAMNVTPLIFATKDILKHTEDLELLSLEWDLERAPSPELLPEQLIVAGGTSEKVSSHVCMLSWEKGVVDPFKIDEHMQILSKKLSDIEIAVLHNEIEYENKGLSVLSKFNDRFNSVIFVEMLDKRFQGSWDSLQIKPEHVDTEIEMKLLTRDDFTMLPPGPRILGRSSLELILPTADENMQIEHFKHRILTPRALETIGKRIPELGRAILNELNVFAYSIEEADIAQGTISMFQDFLNANAIRMDQFTEINAKVEEFSGELLNAVDVFERITEEHIKSGIKARLVGHDSDIKKLIKSNTEGIQVTLSNGLQEALMKSLEREYPLDTEIRAWQLKSTIRYFVNYSKRVAHYFAEALRQYMVVMSARKSLFTMLQNFREEILESEQDSILLTLFHKLYAELYSQLSAVFDRKSYEGAKQHSPSELMSLITKEMIDALKKIELWDLIDFSDVARIVRNKINLEHSPETGNDVTLDETGKALRSMLDSLETLVAELIPDIAHTFLIKQSFRELIDHILEANFDVSEQLKEIVNKAEAKSDAWKSEAMEWIREINEKMNESLTVPERIMLLIRHMHDKVGEGISARSIAHKVALEAESREMAYRDELEQWEKLSAQIEDENKNIRVQIEKRKELVEQATKQFEAEIRDFESSTEELRGEPTEPLSNRIAKIDGEYPHNLREKPIPPEPERSEELVHHLELRDLLNDRIADLERNQEKILDLFLSRLQRLESESQTVTESVLIDLEAFLDYLMNYEIRHLTQLLPRATRAYFTDPKIPDLVYLASYTHEPGTITVKVGSNFLRRRSS